MSDSANPQDPPSASTPQDPFGIEATTTITQNIVINPFGSPEGPQRRSTEWSQNTTNIKLGPGAAASARCEASIGDISADIILRGYGVSEGLGKSIDVPVVLEVDCGNVNINVVSHATRAFLGRCSYSYGLHSIPSSHHRGTSHKVKTERPS